MGRMGVPKVVETDARQVLRGKQAHPLVRNTARLQGATVAWPADQAAPLWQIVRDETKRRCLTRTAIVRQRSVTPAPQAFEPAITGA